MAQSSIGPRVFDSNRLDVAPPSIAGTTRIPQEAPAASAAPAAPASGLPDVKVADVAVTGDMLVDRSVLAAAVTPFVGRHLDLATVAAITDAISAACREADIALYNVSIPPQDFAKGLVVVHLTGGKIVDVAYEGDVAGADLSLTKTYADKILAENPLKRTTLERYLLLMSDISGRKVDSRFDLLGSEGQVRLVINIKRTEVRLGLGIDNLGASNLGNVQVSTGATVNNVLREGDSTRLTYAAPSDFQRFSYIALRHQEIVGSDGLTLAANASYLVQRVTGSNVEAGQSYTLGVQAIYPIIRSLHETLQVVGNFDTLDSRVNEPGIEVANEATRVFRGGAILIASNDSSTRSGSIVALISQGIDGLGARQRLAIYGKPGFTKASMQASYQQFVFDQKLIVRLQLNGQYADERLPSSEFFTYGGVSLGRAFNSATLEGDRGVSSGLTVAMPIGTVADVTSITTGLSDFTKRMVRGIEPYTFVDAAYVENLGVNMRYGHDHGASVGGGVALPVADESNLNLEVASVLVRPQNPDAEHGTRFVAVFRRSF